MLLIPYIIIIPFFLVKLITRKEISFSMGFVFFVLFIFSIFFREIGVDYENYLYLLKEGYYETDFELLSKYLAVFAVTAGDYDYFFVFNFALFNFFVYLGFKEMNFKGVIPVFLFLTFPMICLRYFDYVRQLTSAAIIFYSFSIIFMQNGMSRWFLGGGWVIISSLFHAASLLFLPLIFLYLIFKKILTVNIFLKPFFFLLINLFFFYFSEEIISFLMRYFIDAGMYFNYFSDKNNENGRKIYFFLLFATFFLLIFLKRGVFDINVYMKNLDFMLFILFCGFFLYSVTSPFGEHAGRVFGFFVLILLTLFSICICGVEKKYKSIALTAVFILGSMIYLQMYILVMSRG